MITCVLSVLVMITGLLNVHAMITCVHVLITARRVERTRSDYRRVERTLCTNTRVLHCGFTAVLGP